MNASRSPLIFKFATEEWEFEQIHRLNYDTFVEEIPQHQPSPARRLVDKFHAENTYLICQEKHKLVGMLAARGRRPFSLDQKLPDLDSHLPPSRQVFEVRLLAIEKSYRCSRGGQVLSGLLALLWQHCIEKGYDLGIISGTTRQLKLYQHLGFVPFGLLVGSPGAQFQPMYARLESFEVIARDFLRSAPARSFQSGALNFLPGPVTMRREVRRAFEQPPESHRADSFKADFAATQNLPCELTQARHCEICLGSGTLANDIVGAQISLLGGRGVVASNGEFGRRLIDQARRLHLDFEAVEFPWDEPLDHEFIAHKLDQLGPGAWLWTTHCETSTGALNDLDALKTICAAREAKLCLDAISTIGALPVDLRGVYLAAGASGKGLRSYPGLALAFYHHEAKPAPVSIPRYLDLGNYRAEQGIPFTFSTNLLYALQAAIRRVDWPGRFAKINSLSALVRDALVKLDFKRIGSGQMSPAIFTIELPPEMDSAKIGTRLLEAGFRLSFNSEYLRRKNWIQISLLGECSEENVVALINGIKRVTQKTLLHPLEPALHP
jgi:aspartate aminotransferase-like enzyme